MNESDNTRRNFLLLGATGLGAAFVTACGTKPANAPNIVVSPANNSAGPAAKATPDAKEVTAVEDLMREHGILRRALLVYSEAAMRLRKMPPASRLLHCRRRLSCSAHLAKTNTKRNWKKLIYFRVSSKKLRIAKPQNIQTSLSYSMIAAARSRTTLSP